MKNKIIQKINKKIAYLLPRKVLYLCVIRAWAIATTEKYRTKTPYEINWEMVCKYLDDNELSLSMYAEEYPEKWKEIVKSMEEKESKRKIKRFFHWKSRS